MPFYSNPFDLIYSDARFTNDNFGLAWGDVNGDGINELLVSPVNGAPVFLKYDGVNDTFSDAGINPGSLSSNLFASFAIYDLNNDGKGEVLKMEWQGGSISVWSWSDNQLQRRADMDIIFATPVGARLGCGIIDYQGSTYIFTGSSGGSIYIDQLSGQTAVRQGSFNPGTIQTQGVIVRDIDGDGQLEMAVIDDWASNRVKIFRLVGNDIVNHWSDLNMDFLLSSGSNANSGVFANLEDPNRWDLVLATSIGANPADIIVYKNSVTIPVAPPPGFGSCHLDRV